jgi:WD40 repeat protein
MASRIFKLFKWILLTGTMLVGCQNQAQPLVPSGVLKLAGVIQSLAWHPDGKHIVVGYFNRDEAEVWNVETKQAVFKVHSQRRSINQSGQEVGFSPDGKYLVVQDFLDTKNGIPKFPVSLTDPLELPARADKSRYLLARVWDWQQGKELTPLYGPGAVAYGAVQHGFCWTGGSVPHFVMHRGDTFFVYDLSTGKAMYEVSLRYPFKERPDYGFTYRKMACDPSGPRVAMEGPRLNQEDARMLDFKFDAEKRIQLIVVADIEKREVVKTLLSANLLNGVVYTADGSKLVSFGRPPLRVWDVRQDFRLIGDIVDPPKYTGILTSVPEFDGVVGIADELYVWDLRTLRKVTTALIPRDVFRTAMHSGSHRLAVAAGQSIYFYSLDSQMISKTTKGD